MKKTLLGALGFILIVGTLLGGGLTQVLDWGSAELIGSNITTIGMILGGAYLIKYSLKKDLKTDQTHSESTSKSDEVQSPK